MTDIQTTESQFRLSDGVALYQKSWASSNTAPVARLVHFHGFSDHINNTFDLFPSLAGRGILCTGVDQRGWGQSAKDKTNRGNTGPTANILADYAAFIEAQLQAEPSVPVFVMGHSMGGALVATLASTPKYQDLVSRLGGIILEAPFIGLDPETEPSIITIYMGRLACKILPQFQISQPVKAEAVVRDPAVQQILKNDPLNHGIGTLEMFANMLDRAADLTSGKLKLNDGIRSVYVVHGTNDKVTSYNTSKRWYDSQTGKVADRNFKSYEGWSHLLHADLPENRQLFADDIAQWILARV
ncbi:hypothetical protein EYZ11_001331 [Aspergillus tanneri]|uniref:Serine aminopeptidase S33 domain-containing protein n=1 Tax=Aspergillus tanneri TaxID=1220188 RepID=A0A4S3JUT7_9EURO|nr:uncharacterized protein ATNIH1004_002969 [Aspergillus tanneri]KAA8650287.1 hypothetical protein ATNIH1004_002969 [Aspergillus tanneri]THC99156.1 hypothetical protein EYZ11_001331 [Aspergillus tanneri]